MARPVMTMALFGAAFAALVAGAVWKHQQDAPPSDLYWTPERIAESERLGVDVPRHLYPEEGAIAGLARGAVLETDFSAFKSVIARDLRVFRILEINWAGLTSYLVGIEAQQGRYLVITAAAPQPGAANRQLEICEAPLDSRLAKRIIAAWDDVVSETRPTRLMPHMGPDGSFSHFASRPGRGGLMVGMIWGSARPFKPGWLDDLADGLRELCSQKDKRKVMADIEQALRAIETAPPLR